MGLFTETTPSLSATWSCRDYHSILIFLAIIIVQYAETMRVLGRFFSEPNERQQWYVVLRHAGQFHMHSKMAACCFTLLCCIALCP